ncbi:MAG: oligosaccharide flippase family protein [Rhizobiaceae bacterium]|nr:oligosaccharide flippase family protein [Rhizobiaceae bacterium]
MSALLGRTLIVTAVRIVYLALWFVAITAAYRHLGQLPDGLAQAGILAVALATIKMVTTALGDPLDLDVVRRVAPALHDDPDEALAAWRAAQQIRLLLAAVVLAGALLLAKPVADRLLHDASWSTPILLAGVAAAMEFVYRGYLADYQSRERFGSLLRLEGLLQILRVASVGGLLLADRLTASAFLMAYAASVSVAAVSAYALSDRGRRRVWVWSPAATRKTLDYVRWVAPALMLSAVVERLDLLLLSGMRGPEQSGLYGALMPLLLVPEMVVGLAMVVLQPRVADLAAKGKLLDLWVGVCKLTVPLAAAATVVVLLFAEPLIGLTIGPAYRDSGLVLRLLFVAAMFWVAVVPVALSFVVMTQPRATLLVCALQGVLVLLAGSILIPEHGAVGAAISVLVMRVTTGLVLCGVALHALRPARADVRIAAG